MSRFLLFADQDMNEIQNEHYHESCGFFRWIAEVVSAPRIGAGNIYGLVNERPKILMTQLRRNDTLKL